MKCPFDGETLMITERSGVEIDYCPKCRGVWLDRGELDKIIDRTAAPDAVRGGSPYGRSGDENASRKRPEKRRESFLGELFDF